MFGASSFTFLGPMFGALGVVSTVAAAITTGSSLVDVLVTVAAAVTALSVIWAQAARPVLRAANMFTEIAPIIIEIGTEFRGADGRSTLRSLMHDTNNELAALSGLYMSLEQEVTELYKVKAANGVTLAANGVTLAANGETLASIEERVASLMREVKTANGRTLAELADRAESRRIEDLPDGTSTPEEEQHLRDAPL